MGVQAEGDFTEDREDLMSEDGGASYLDESFVEIRYKDTNSEC